jgi:hypothetical protein
MGPIAEPGRSQADLTFMMDGAFEILGLRVMNVEN